MALNKFMHPRNIYKTPPDFENMTKIFSEFSGIAKMVSTYLPNYLDRVVIVQFDFYLTTYNRKLNVFAQYKH